MRAHIGISFSHPKEAQVAEQLSAGAWRKDALLFQRKQQRLNGSQVLWDCSSDPLHINTSILTISDAYPNLLQSRQHHCC